MSVHTPQNSALSTKHYLFDGLGSVVALTDTRGNKTRDYAYDEWGNELWPGGDDENPYRFTGRWGGFTEDATGRVLNWHRWYAGETGRWGSRDPIGIAGGMNIFVAVLNNHVNFIDPSGKRPIEECQREYQECLWRIMLPISDPVTNWAEGKAASSSEAATQLAKQRASKLKYPRKSSVVRCLSEDASDFLKQSRILKWINRLQLSLGWLYWKQYNDCEEQYRACNPTSEW
jgi:RHS repeat-associated protein